MKKFNWLLVMLLLALVPVLLDQTENDSEIVFS